MQQLQLIIKNQLIQYLEEQHTLTTVQHGCQQSKSTVTAMVQQTEKIAYGFD